MRCSICLFSFFLLFVQVECQEKEEDPLKTVDLLDCPCSLSTNPLKDFNSFTVLLTNNSQGTDLLLKELETLGKVQKFSISDPEGINYEGMGTGARLLFMVTELNVLGEKEVKTFRTSLLLSTSIEILITQNKVDDSYVWAANMFSNKEQLPLAVSQVLKQFMTYYQEVNPSEKPIFYVYL